MRPGLYSRGWWVEWFAGVPLYSCWHCCHTHRYRHTGIQEQVWEKGVGKTDRRRAQKNNNNTNCHRWTMTHQVWTFSLKSIVWVVYRCSFNQLLVKQEDKVYLLGTVFSCGLIHIFMSAGWCAWVKINYSVVFMLIKEHVTSPTVSHCCVFVFWITMELCGTEIYHRYITLWYTQNTHLLTSKCIYWAQQSRIKTWQLTSFYRFSDLEYIYFPVF